ncbi:hypothetical protein [Paenibacillus polymyxa]|uniref:hypothetical protein n=1 Tax=Paenibacillus polymyxa TaxID=1406 RepID=UPI002AB454A8|nr:hypothetical protein [Paenibacillus polymyxa]MDY8023355.1 hypothetical protein [Paenibacillus polymyxa]
MSKFENREEMLKAKLALLKGYSELDPNDKTFEMLIEATEKEISEIQDTDWDDEYTEDEKEQLEMIDLLIKIINEHGLHEEAIDRIVGIAQQKKIRYAYADSIISFLRNSGDEY